MELAEELFRERVCGIDVSASDVKACVRVPGPRGGRTQTVRTFTTTTPGLLCLLDWLVDQQIQLTVMESTGVYWKPVYYTLETILPETWLVNPQQVKKVPGRKTDVTDAQWLARLAENGLVRPSFVPPPAFRDLRQSTRYRTALVNDRTREVQRLHDLLVDAGIRLSLVASDITGVSGTAMLQALVDGQSDPQQLAELARGRLRNKREALVEALTGHFTSFHAAMAARMMHRIHQADRDIADIEMLIAVQLFPFRRQMDRLMTIPGVSEHIATVIVAEIGIDMTRFPTAANLVSWAGLCPGNNESGGRKLSGTTRKGNPHLRGALGQAAAVISQHRGTYLNTCYWRVANHRGKGRAGVAVSRMIAEAAYYMLAHDVDYQDLGPDYLTRRIDPAKRAGRLIHQLGQLGYQVTISPAA